MLLLRAGALGVPKAGAGAPARAHPTYLDDAAYMMKQHQIRRLLVMNENKKLVGILALGDLAVEKEGVAAEALGGISQPAEPARH